MSHESYIFISTPGLIGIKMTFAVGMNLHLVNFLLKSSIQMCLVFMNGTSILQVTQRAVLYVTSSFPLTSGLMSVRLSASSPLFLFPLLPTKITTQSNLLRPFGIHILWCHVLLTNAPVSTIN